jgi:hypothetical protein
MVALKSNTPNYCTQCVCAQENWFNLQGKKGRNEEMTWDDLLTSLWK